MNNTLLYNRISVHFSKGVRSLRATTRFRQGEIIAYLPSSTVASPDRFSLEVLPGVHIDCSDSPVGAINHSCEPNAAVKSNYILAMACINEGEEITLDYKRTESKLASPFVCLCQSKKCRGRIE